MATSRTRKPPQRPVDYANIGVAGRKTGVTLKDSGIRDEHGLEPIDGIFSSPEKPAWTPRSNGGSHTIVEERDMSIGNSTVPEPTEVLTSRGITMPPRSRSPIKTNLNSSPRKSAGPPASPLRTPHAKAAENSVKARTVKVQSDSSPSVVKAADTAGKAIRRSPSAARKRKRGRYIYDINVTEPEDDTLGDTVQTTTITHPSTEHDVTGNHNILQVDDNLGSTAHVEAEDQNLKVPVGDSILQYKSSKRKSQKNTRHQTDDITHISSPRGHELSVVENSSAPKARRGRPPKIKGGNERVKAVVSNPENHENEGRPKKNPRIANLPQTQEIQASGRDPDSHAAPRRARKPDQRTTVDNYVSDIGRPKSRGLVLLRSETPADDHGAQILRSGRTSVKPMAYWRNERIVYDRTNVDGVRMPLLGIKEVIRTEEPLQPDKRKGRGKKARPVVQPQEEDEDADPWEVEAGVLEGTIMEWDPETQKASEEDFIDTELAYASKGLKQVTRDVKGATFQYGKTVTLPFFHSGVVDLPPGGEKKMKNSRVNHMVFWVFSGRVNVDVSNNNFSIGKGGMWQVPRGNFYSLANPYDYPARIFFAQGCYMSEQHGTEVSK